MRRKRLLAVVCNACLIVTADRTAGGAAEDTKQAAALARVAFEHARDTGDFWSASKL
jgi:hypothetical protein